MYFSFTSVVTLVTCAVLVLTDVACAYKYYPELDGWVARQPIVATWSEALHQCSSEDAILMSPNTDQHLRVMQSLIDGDFSHFVGIKSMLHPRLFVSVEGISLVDMPISNIMKRTQPQIGQCVAMDRANVYAVSCTSTFPFFCFRIRNSKQNVTECGTFNEGYVLNKVTGSCYKYYNEDKVWNDAYWTCVTDGAYLAEVNNEVEAQELAKLGKHQLNHILIGLRAWNETGQWMSVLAKPLLDIYHTFENGLPSSTCCQVGSLEHSTHKFYLKTDTDKRNFICEKDPNNIRYSINEQHEIEVY